jgi:hypothetical protein
MAVQEYGKILLEYLSSKPDSTTVNGQRLDDDFVNFESKCRQNKAVYYAAYPNVTRFDLTNILYVNMYMICPYDARPAFIIHKKCHNIK